MIQNIGIGINVFSSKDFYTETLQKALKEYCNNNRFPFHIEYEEDSVRLAFIFRGSWYLSDIKVLIENNVLKENYLPNGYPSEW